MNLKINRLKSAKETAEILLSDLKTYKKNVDNSRDEINSAFSFSWEGECMSDFKKKYGIAIDYLSSSVIDGSKNIKEDIQNKINEIQSLIKSKNYAIKSLEKQLESISD